MRLAARVLRQKSKLTAFVHQCSPRNSRYYIAFIGKPAASPVQVDQPKSTRMSVVFPDFYDSRNTAMPTVVPTEGLRHLEPTSKINLLDDGSRDAIRPKIVVGRPHEKEKRYAVCRSQDASTIEASRLPWPSSLPAKSSTTWILTYKIHLF